MVEQNCVYERTMTVKYNNKNKITYSEEDSKLFSKILQKVNRDLYTNRMPVLDYCKVAPVVFSEVNKEEYLPYTKRTMDTTYQVWNQGKNLYSTYCEENRDIAYNAISNYAESCGVSGGAFTHTTQEVHEENVIESWPTLENHCLIPYLFVDGDKSFGIDVKVRSWSPDVCINVEGQKVMLSTIFRLYRNKSELEFGITWKAPIKSTKANIEKHLVDIPEVILATIMNTVETILNSNDWPINEDDTTIDCVTQSNINTKAECSPAVISSLRKTKAEL